MTPMTTLPVEAREEMISLTYRYRVKSRIGELNRMAKAVNLVWNYCEDAQKHAIKWGQRWPSAYDLQKKTSGTSTELGVLAESINVVCERYYRSRRQSKRRSLRYRGRRSLGWVPFKATNVKRTGSAFVYRGTTFKVAFSRPLPTESQIVDGGSFSQDARGRWYLNLCLKVPALATRSPSAVGIDLGLKDLAVLSTGERVENPRVGSAMARRLSLAQRARKRRMVTALNARVANQRRDYLHKISTIIVGSYSRIVVGNIDAAALRQTKIARSVGDAGWSTFRKFLQYKAIARGGKYEEVNEFMTTRCCSSCGSITGPAGSKQLGIRQWVCGDCGTSHDRDQNAAINILARAAHRTLAEGATVGGNANVCSAFATLSASGELG